MICLAKFNINIHAYFYSCFYYMQHSICYSNVISQFLDAIIVEFFYLMVKSGKSFVKIGSCFQIAPFFLFYQNFQPLHPVYSDSSPVLFTYLILPNVPASSLIRTLPPPTPTRLFGTHAMSKSKQMQSKSFDKSVRSAPKKIYYQFFSSISLSSKERHAVDCIIF